MINPHHLRAIIIQTLKELDLHSESAVNLLLGTAAQESRLGTYLHQIGGGPALGIYQMEPATERDIWKNYLDYRPKILSKVTRVSGLIRPRSLHLTGNLIYATVMARLHYYRAPGQLPDADDTPGLAEYWKQHYNTPAGKGTAGEFVQNYYLLIK